MKQTYLFIWPKKKWSCWYPNRGIYFGLNLESTCLWCHYLKVREQVECCAFDDKATTCIQNLWIFSDCRNTMRRSAERRASSTERRSGVPTYGGSNPRKRSSSMDRLSNFGTNFGRQSTSGRPSVAPLRVRNEGNIKTKNSSHDPRGSFGWKPQSSGAGLLGSSRKTPQKRLL